MLSSLQLETAPTSPEETPESLTFSNLVKIQNAHPMIHVILSTVQMIEPHAPVDHDNPDVGTHDPPSNPARGCVSVQKCKYAACAATRSVSYFVQAYLKYILFEKISQVFPFATLQFLIPYFAHPLQKRVRLDIPLLSCYTIGMFPEYLPRLGESVIYFDDDGRPHHAQVAWVLVDEPFAVEHTRPRLTLTVLYFDGVWRPHRFVEPAYHDGEREKKINKWCIQDDLEMGRLTIEQPTI